MPGVGDTAAFASEVSPSRRLLARLRDVMAASGDGATRLDKIVQLIASEMVAEVLNTPQRSTRTAAFSRRPRPDSPR